MNYLAAYIEKNKIHWVIAEAENALVLEHGSYSTIPQSNSSEEDAPESETFNTYPSLSYVESLAFISSEIAHTLELDLPFEDPKKAEKIIPLQLQDKVPFDLDDVHFIVKDHPTKIDETYRYFISYVNKPIFENILRVSSENGINFETITSETFLLEPLFMALQLASESDDNLNLNKDYSISIGYLSTDNDSEILKREGIILILSGKDTLHARKLSLPLQNNFLLPYFESHIAISKNASKIESGENDEKISHLLFCPANINQETKDVLKRLPNFQIEYMEPEYAENVEEIVNTKLLFALYSFQTFTYLVNEKNDEELSLPNLREGLYRYRAPFTELKEAFLDQIAPIALVILFGILTICFKFLIPIKKNNILSEKAYTLTAQELGRPIQKGSEIQELESSISELETKLGNLNGVSSFSPIDWLYTLSTLIPENLDCEIDSISISSDGMSFRGTVKDYPTSGKLDSLLASLKTQYPNKFCQTTLTAEENASSQNRKPIVGEIILCD